MVWEKFKKLFGRDIEEVSDLLYGDAVVSKRFEKGEEKVIIKRRSELPPYNGNGPKIGLIGIEAVPYTQREPDKFYVTFFGDNVSFYFEDKNVFDQFGDGEDIKLAYREVYQNKDSKPTKSYKLVEIIRLN